MLTHTRLKEILYYHPESGDFVWLEKIARKIKIGTQAGSLDGAGYTQIKIGGCTYRAQRLAWFYMHRHWPKHKIDHEDTVKHHNWWGNLRVASTAQNGFNARLSRANSTGLKNISWSKRSRK